MSIKSPPVYFLGFETCLNCREAVFAAEAADLEADCIRYRWTCVSQVLSGEGAMSTDTKRFRDRAADELRDSRKKLPSGQDKANHVKRAASYKALANNEEWLGGEKRGRFAAWIFIGAPVCGCRPSRAACFVTLN